MHRNADAVRVNKVAVAVIHANGSRGNIAVRVLMTNFVQRIPAADI